MKTKFSIFILSLFISGLGLSVSNGLNAESSNCGEQNFGYKKQFLVSCSKAKVDRICVIRCDQPNMPTIGI